MTLFQLSDQGGGIPYSQKEILFQYMYTTAPQPLPSHNREGSAPLVRHTRCNIPQTNTENFEELCRQLHTSQSSAMLSYSIEDFRSLVCEPRHEKTNVQVSDQVRHKPAGLPRSGKKVWKMNFFPGQGKVREFQF